MTYDIWRRQTADYGSTRWIQTRHSVEARTDKEAQYKVRRKFNGAGFHSMMLIALPEGVFPPW